MVKRSNLLISVFATFLVNDSDGFSTSSNAKNIKTASLRAPTRLDMVATTSSGGNFFDDFNHHRRDGNDGNDSSSSSSSNNNRVQHESTGRSVSSSKFVTGDDLHRLRHQVLAMRLELQEARRNGDVERVSDLEKAIMKTQQVDAEFVYTVSLEREELAHQAGNMIEAQRFHERAMEARSALPQFQLEGLWVGKYGEEQGYEMINVTYHGDTLLAHKVTSGTKHVPRGAETFRVDLAPLFAKESKRSANNHNRPTNDNTAEQQEDYHEVLSPIELGDSAAKQWGCKFLQRFAGQGQVASEGFQDSQWMEGQLILVNEYFSFAWLPIGHQVFFGRPTPELILKLMKDENTRGSVNDHLSPARSFLEKCWEETEYIEDDLEIDRQYFMSTNSDYDQEGCFE
jgi:hypothetical protein